MDLVPFDFSMNLGIYRSSGWASLVVFPLSHCGIMTYSICPRLPGRRYGVPERTAPPPPWPEDIGIQGIQHPSNPSVSDQSKARGTPA